VGASIAAGDAAGDEEDKLPTVFAGGVDELRSRWSGAPFLCHRLGPTLEKNFIAHNAAEELF
jgi:hypothetical protein